MENNSTETQPQDLKPMEFRITDPTEFIKAIHWNKPELMEAIKARVASYENVVYTADTIKQAKSDRAELNKLIKAIEDKRKEVKKQLLEPYEEFEAEVKELLAVIKKPTEMIDKQVKEYEQQQKDFKKSQLKTQFDRDHLAKELSGKVTFEDVFEERYLNVSVSLASAWTDISNKLKKIQTEIDMINRKDSLHRHSMMSVYIKSQFDIVKALEHEAQLVEMAKQEEERKAREAELKAREEERKAREEELRKQDEARLEAQKAAMEAESKKGSDTPEDPEEQPDPQEIKDTDMDGAGEGQHDKTRPENIYSALFSASGTRDQLAGLVRYMSDNGISWRQLPASPERPVAQAS